MSFLSQFSKNFTPEERETELYALWSTIGVNTEKTLLEEIQAQITEMSDINNFSEDTLRSWLAFFNAKIPYRTSCLTQITVSIANDIDFVKIPKYSQLKTSTGIIYTQLDELNLVKENQSSSTAIQGIIVKETGTYSNLIKVQASNPDLGYLELFINGQKIDEISYTTSYDNLMYIGSWKPQGESEFGGTPFLQNEVGMKGQFYTVISDGTTKFSEDGIEIEFRTGDLVVYDGDSWQKITSNNNLRPIQFMNSYGIPSNGYYAYYYEGYLYVKVFSGSQVEDPEGKFYELNYISSDGIQGKIFENSLSYIDTFRDSNENEVVLNVTNTDSTSGVNQPDVGKLGLILKQKLFSSINVSSIPEYTWWFKSQPEVGDCLVLGDYERWIRSGKTVSETTGIVNIYLVDPDGKELSEDLQNLLIDRLQPYKDIAVLRVTQFTEVQNCLMFSYNSTEDVEKFNLYLKSMAYQFYTLSYLQSIGMSIFESLDLSLFLKYVFNNSPYSFSGLVVKGYHYKEVTVSSDLKDEGINVLSYLDEKVGSGWYEVSYSGLDGNEKVVILDEILEDLSSTSLSIAGVYRRNDGVKIGTRTETYVTFDLDNFTDWGDSDLLLKCYWGMKNEGILSIGSNEGLRRLIDVRVSGVSV